MKPNHFSVLMAGVFLPLAAAGGAGVDRLGDPLPEGAAQRLGTTRMRTPVSDLCYLPDGRGALAVGSSLEVWNLAEGALESRQQVGGAGLVSLDLRKDGQALLVGDAAGNVHEWDPAAGRVLRTWPTEQEGLRTARYSTDGKRVLTTGSLTLKEWDLATGKELVAIAGKMHSFQEAIYTADGKGAIVGGSAGSGEVVAQYDLATGELRHQWLRDYSTSGRSLALSPDGRRLLAGSRSMATEWELEDHEMLRRFTGHQGGAVVSVAYCPDPDQLLTGSRDGSIRRWNRRTGEVLARWFPHSGHVRHLRVSPDGRWVLSSGGGTVAETSLEDGSPRIAWDRHDEAVEAVALLANERVVSGSADRTLRVWDYRSGRSLVTIPGATLGARAVAVSPDGRRAATGCGDGIIREFDMQNGSLRWEMPGHAGFVYSLAYTPSGDSLVSCAGDGTIFVRGAGERPGRPMWVFPGDRDAVTGHRGGVLSLALSPDGKSVLSGGRDGTVRLWSIEKPPWDQDPRKRVLEGHRGWVEAVAFAGESVGLSGSRDGRILKWDLNTGELLSEIPFGRRVLALACSADGKTLCAGGDNGAILVLDLATGQEKAKLTGHRSGVLSLALTADGTRLISAGQDTTLLVWDMP